MGRARADADEPAATKPAKRNPGANQTLSRGGELGHTAKRVRPYGKKGSAVRQKGFGRTVKSRTKRRDLGRKSQILTISIF